MLRADLPTPALVLDLPAFERNIVRMADFAAKHGVMLRPHAKTHKCVEIAKRQIAAGAIGICCAKLGEAEALAAGGIADIHLTSPIVTPGALARLVALRIETLSIVADHPDNVRALAAAGEGPLTVFIDVDPGNLRTGVASPEAAVELAGLIAAAPNLRLGGVQYYCGSQQHIQRAGERRAVLVEKAGYLRTVLAALRGAGHEISIVTGGGTGSFAIDIELGLLTEIQAGSYIVMDREYADCEPAPGQPRFEHALFVDATVVSANAPGRVTIDAGLKALAADAGAPVVHERTGTYRFTGDEHGAIIDDISLPRLGERVVIRPAHCDPTVNLYDAFHVIDGDSVVAVWPIDARGRST